MHIYLPISYIRDELATNPPCGVLWIEFHKILFGEETNFMKLSQQFSIEYFICGRNTMLVTQSVSYDTVSSLVGIIIFLITYTPQLYVSEAEHGIVTINEQYCCDR